MASSIGAKAHEREFRMVVGSFHGHAHNRGCQVNWHPLYLKNMGRADFEGCERVFRSGNNLAPGTRHASFFRRHQVMKQHFSFWDDDKYAALGLYWIVDLRSGISTLIRYQQGHFSTDTTRRRFPSSQRFRQNLLRSKHSCTSQMMTSRAIFRMSRPICKASRRNHHMKLCSTNT